MCTNRWYSGLELATWQACEMPPLLHKALSPAVLCSVPCWGILFHAKQANYTVMLRWCRTSTASAALACLLVCERMNKYEHEIRSRAARAAKRNLRGGKERNEKWGECKKISLQGACGREIKRNKWSEVLVNIAKCREKLFTAQTIQSNLLWMKLWQCALGKISKFVWFTSL